MMKSILLSTILLMCTSVFADSFGSGENQFDIEFVTISGDASSANGTYIGVDRDEGFVDTGYDYRMGTYEITNDQWAKFQANIAPTQVTGSPWDAYNDSADWTGTNVPTNRISWYEAAQFVNYLNTSTGNPAAYKFAGTQGTGGYTLGIWEAGDIGFEASNPFRNSNAKYFLPTEDEWVKAAYWNGTSLQTYATVDNSTPIAGVDTNYNSIAGPNYDEMGGQPWAVGSGSEELNGTYDMMGNIYEWMESPYFTGDYMYDSQRSMRGSSYEGIYNNTLRSSDRNNSNPYNEYDFLGFRVASVPEPATLLLLGMGGLLIRKKQLN